MFNGGIMYYINLKSKNLKRSSKQTLNMKQDQKITKQLRFVLMFYLNSQGNIVKLYDRKGAFG